jgi:hypothetical protein
MVVGCVDDRVPTEGRDVSLFHTHEETHEEALLFVGLLLGTPDHYLSTTTGALFDTHGEGVAFVDSEIVPHVLGNGDATPDTDGNVAVVQRPVDGHALSSFLDLQPNNIAERKDLARWLGRDLKLSKVVFVLGTEFRGKTERLTLSMWQGWPPTEGRRRLAHELE